MTDEIMRPVQDMESGVGFGRLVPPDRHGMGRSIVGSLPRIWRLVSAHPREVGRA
jgi:hypothetical protein